jgi:putative flippase GtrA
MAAVLFNYGAARRAVFLSRERHRVLLPKYLLLVAGSGLASYGLIHLLRSALPVSVMAAKVSAETLLFLVNFFIQRDFVFTRRRSGQGVTDWTRYYASTPFTARLTRRYTIAVLLSVLKKYAGFGASGGRTLVELGGANSCFLDPIRRELRPRMYHVVDANRYGLRLLQQRIGQARGVRLHWGDVRDLSLDVRADAVISVGLVEHFGAADTRKVILRHLDLLHAGGCAVVSFPTPTPLYRMARFLAEQLGLWRFPDERPLLPAEIREAVRNRGEVVFEKTLWPLVFTQHLMVIRKVEAACSPRAEAAP